MSVLRRQKVQKANIWMVGARAYSLGLRKIDWELNLSVTGAGGKHSNMLRREHVDMHVHSYSQESLFTHKGAPTCVVCTFNPDHLCLLLLSNWDQHFLQLGIKGSTIKGGLSGTVFLCLLYISKCTMCNMNACDEDQMRFLNFTQIDAQLCCLRSGWLEFSRCAQAEPYVQPLTMRLPTSWDYHNQQRLGLKIFKPNLLLIPISILYYRYIYYL